MSSRLDPLPVDASDELADAHFAVLLADQEVAELEGNLRQARGRQTACNQRFAVLFELHGGQGNLLTDLKEEQ